MTATSQTFGAHTLAEIFSQPQCWTECLGVLEAPGGWESVAGKFSSEREWVFVGCGSSYYIALVAAATWSAVTGGKSRAVPASDLLLFPFLLPGDPGGYQPVLISRSGRTSEVLRVGEFFERRQNVRTLAITCASSTPLAEISSATMTLPAADEQSTVMTRSFTSMLLALQGLAAMRGALPQLQASFGSLAAQVKPQLEDFATRLREFVETQEFQDHVFLGQGPYFGIACEAALKVTEMSRSYAQSYHTLEFRHGPKSIVGPETLVTFFVSEYGFEAERSVLEEVKSLGGTTLVVANRADEKTRGAADLLIELGLSVPETIRPAAALIPGQLLGCYTGLKKGHDPDRPRHLTRVVVLDDDK